MLPLFLVLSLIYVVVYSLSLVIAAVPGGGGGYSEIVLVKIGLFNLFHHVQ